VNSTLPRSKLRTLLLRAALAYLAISVVSISTARADCVGPVACCVDDAAEVTVPLPERIRLGFRLQRVQAVAEQSGTWTGEVNVITRWPAGGLRPELSYRNAEGDVAVSVDETHLLRGQCVREQRLHGHFENWFRLRRFPFDTQVLRVLLEERHLTDAQATWEPELWPNVLSIDAYRELSAWQFDSYPSLRVKRSSFAAAPGGLRPQLLIVSVPVSRLWQFYLTRYFFPLFLIVALAYCLFWIKPEDLGSAASLGITCMLAIIAFQITQSDSLPRVGYMTLADRVYTTCYVATAIALLVAVGESYLATHGHIALAYKIDRAGRWLFPLAFFLAIALTVAAGWASYVDDPAADIPRRLPEPTAPPGER
jgi:hypothetical protein